jgi:HKD family nuclease
MELGLYESLVTDGVQSALLALADDLIPTTRHVDDADLPHVLSRHVQALVERVLSEVKDPARRLTIVNGVIAQLADEASRVTDPATQLLRIVGPPSPGTTAFGELRPGTPLAEAALLTNTKGEPSLGAELRAEIDTCDEVDLLCAFVKWHGIRLLEPELGRLKLRGSPFRVITTTYMGATERAALDRLVREFAAEVKIQYDAQRTRLHAKAWMFRRQTQFDTAYVGSSNLSRAALLDGVEWNVRLSRIGTPALLEKFRATFDTYWNDSTFESYDPDTDRDRLDDALAEASGRTSHDRVTISLSGLEVRPYAYQLEMLEALDVERFVHDRHRNLIVAATGTGKTVIAALDYRGLCVEQGADRPSLLFVAHRREILEQSLRTYREVLADPAFGELYVGGVRPERWRHVFASVQSLNSYGVQNIPSNAYDIVVIDEFHHAEAATYRRILDHLTPSAASSVVGPRRSFACGMRSARTFSAHSTTLQSRMERTCGALAGAVGGTTRTSSPTCTPATTSAQKLW